MEASAMNVRLRIGGDPDPLSVARRLDLRAAGWLRLANRATSSGFLYTSFISFPAIAAFERAGGRQVSSTRRLSHSYACRDDDPSLALPLSETDRRGWHGRDLPRDRRRARPCGRDQGARRAVREERGDQTAD